MSDIVIRGMEMPKQGWKRLILLPDGEVREICGDEAVRATDARAVELPPHGDLISKLETVKELMKVMCEGCKHTDDCSWCAMAEYRQIVENAPTVLEASEI